MELTVNTFLKGLLCDTNPMVQGTDTLTDALNATIITMNGNEVILQNDMGNRRVDNAFLPPGYEPVGMKEYGGVIYVASYNPITGKSLIGSFPSPERKIDTTDNNGDLYTVQDIFDFGKNTDGYLTETVKLLQLTKDDILIHAGDKFMIYGKNSYNGELSSDYITNWNNITGKKATSPKNRKYTLSIGVLNSQNEFVDITKELLRVNSSGNIVNFDENDSDIYKFNKEYFIKSADISNPSTYTINDTNLILERQKLDVNTYSHKLVGPLYLKSEINIPTTFNYNIYGIKNTSNTEIVIEGYFTYNCPDGVTNSTSTGNEFYDTFDTGEIKLYDTNDNDITLCNFNFIINKYNGSNLSNSANIISNPSETTGVSSYDPVSNLYSVKVTKKYTISLTSGTINYSIKVGNNTDGYIKSLSIENGILNLDKLNSGEVKLTAWRFYNDFENRNTILTYSFEAYPKYGEEYTGVEFSFRDNVSWTNYYNELSNYNSGRETHIILNAVIPYSSISYESDYDLNNDNKIDKDDYDAATDNEVKEYIRNLLIATGTNIPYEAVEPIEPNSNGGLVTIYAEIRNGRNTIVFNWDEYKFIPRKVYSVTYRVSSSNGTSINSNNSDKYWFITTELYNSHYSIYSSDTFWDNYCKDGLNNRPISFNVSIGLDPHIKNSSKLLTPPEYEGNMVGVRNQIITFNCKYTYKLDISDNSNYYIKDENLYPDFIKLKNGVYPIINNAKISVIGTQVLGENDTVENIFNNRVNIYTSNSSNSDLLITNTFIDFNESTSILHSERGITGQFSYYDRFKSIGKIISRIKNAFVKISDVKDILFQVNDNYGGGGVFADSHAKDWGKDDTHFINVVTGQYNQNIRKSGFTNNTTDPENNDNGGADCVHNLANKNKNEHYSFKVKDYKDDIYLYFNYNLPHDQIITYMFPSISGSPDTLEVISKNDRSTADFENNQDRPIGNYSRVWWRTSDKEWALFDEILSINNITNNHQNNELITSSMLSKFTIVILKLATHYQINIIPAYERNINSSHLKFKLDNIDYTSLLSTTDGTPLHRILSFNNVNNYSTLTIIFEAGFNSYTSGSTTITNQVGSQSISTGIISRLTDSNPSYSITTQYSSSNSSLTHSANITTSLFKKDYYYCAYSDYLYNSSDNTYPTIYEIDTLNLSFNQKINDLLLLSIIYGKNTSNSISNAPHTDVSSIGVINNLLITELQEYLPIEYATALNSPSRTVSYTNYLDDISSIITAFGGIIDSEDPNFTVENEQGIWINLLSGDEFRDKLDEAKEVSNIVLDSGLLMDYLNVSLDPLYLYELLSDGTLRKQEKKLFVDTENVKETEHGPLNTLLYNLNTVSSPDYRYNVVWFHGSADHCTDLDFSGLNIIEKI